MAWTCELRWMVAVQCPLAHYVCLPVKVSWLQHVKAMYVDLDSLKDTGQQTRNDIVEANCYLVDNW